MVDRPITFSAPMVRALLEGRKTQTRRLLKPQPKLFDVAPGVLCDLGVEYCDDEPWPRLRLGRVIKAQEVRFRPGMRLWVREAHAILPRTAYRGSIGVGTIDQVEHPTDGYSAAVFREGFDRSGRLQWKPSIHMPRWASRLTLTVTDVRVQSLQDISLADELAEGCPIDPDYRDTTLDGSGPPMVKIGIASWQSPRSWFHGLWDSLHKPPHAWNANPTVAAITFAVERRNIDAGPIGVGIAVEGSAA